jgi:hypothetical protein
MPMHIPSLDALESRDDRWLDAELRLARLRSELAIVRALADHIDHLAGTEPVDGLCEQVVEEMARLGCRLLEAAGSLTRPRAEGSGVFVRGSPAGLAVGPLDSPCAYPRTPAPPRK